MENTAVITINALIKRFPVGGDFFTALKDVDLTLGTGEFTGLVGPSGSGKTTLLNIIGGLDSPSEGQVSVLGQSLNDTSHKERALLRRKHMGFIFQSYNLLPVYTVFENVELPLILNKIDSEQRYKRVAQAIDWVGLSDKRDSRPAMLSGGECQRTAIARAIVTEPLVVLADEPTGALDTANAANIMEVFGGLQSSERAVCIVTHDRDVARLTPRQISMLDGQVVADEEQATSRVIGP